MESILFKRPNGEVYCTLTYNEEENCLYDVWDGAFGLQENFVNVVLTSIDLQIKYNIPKLFSDQRYLKGSFDTAMKLIGAEMATRTVFPPFHYHAVVLSKNLFSQLSINDFAEKAEVNHEIKRFDDMEAARKWLFTK